MTMFELIKLIVYKLAIFVINVTVSLLYLFSYIFLPFTKAIVTKILAKSDIRVNGSRPYDPKVVDERFYCLVAKYSYTGLVDAYGNGYFECSDICEFFLKIHQSKYYKAMCYHPSLMWRSFFARNFCEKTEAKSVGEAYDNGSWNMEKDSDDCNTVSIGYFKNAETLEEAYDAKHDLVARKLKLKPGMRVVDIGCGEGSLCKYLAQKYDVDVTGINVSKVMVEKARKNCKGLKINFKVMDGKCINEIYDRITCIAMIEHMSPTELRSFFENVYRCLTDEGIFFIECYTLNASTFPIIDDKSWRIFKTFTVFHYYFDVLKAAEDLFVIEDVQNLRFHSANTLKLWVDGIDANSESKITVNGNNNNRGRKALYADSYAMQASCHMDAFHIVFSKNGLKTRYDAVI